MGQPSPAMCSALLVAAALLLAQSTMVPAAAARTPARLSSRQPDRERHILHLQHHRSLLQQKPLSRPTQAAGSSSSSAANVTTTASASTAVTGDTNSTTAASPAPSVPSGPATMTAGPTPLQPPPAGPTDGPQGPAGSVNGVPWDPTDTDNRDSQSTAADSSVADGPSKGCQFIRGVAFGAPDAKDQQGNILAPGFQWDPAINPLMQNMTTLLQTVTMGSGWQLQATDNAAQCCNLCLAHTDTDPQKPGAQVVGKPCDVFTWVPAAAWGVDTAAANTAGSLSAVAANNKAPAAAVVANGACLLITLGPTNAAVALVWGTDSSAQSGVPYLSRR